MGHFMPIKVNMSSLGNAVASRASPRPIKPNISGMSIASMAGANQMTTNTVASPASGEQIHLQRDLDFLCNVRFCDDF